MRSFSLLEYAFEPTFVGHIPMIPHGPTSLLQMRLRFMLDRMTSLSEGRRVSRELFDFRDCEFEYCTSDEKKENYAHCQFLLRVLETFGWHMPPEFLLTYVEKVASEYERILGRRWIFASLVQECDDDIQAAVLGGVRELEVHAGIDKFSPEIQPSQNSHRLSSSPKRQRAIISTTCLRF